MAVSSVSDEVDDGRTVEMELETSTGWQYDALSTV
jgi:hypothetical protein